MYTLFVCIDRIASTLLSALSGSFSRLYPIIFLLFIE